MDPVEQAVKQMMTTVKCTACGTNYESDNVSILGHQEELWFLMVTCARCHTRGLVAALVKSEDEPSAVLTDPATAEILPTPEANEIAPDVEVTAEDVQEIHGFLEDFDGDFHGLFGKDDDER